MAFELRFGLHEVHAIAAGYRNQRGEHRDGYAGIVRGAELSREQLSELASWKSPRRAALVAQNTDADVREASRIALSATSEMLRIGILTSLDGVGWPMASVILHFIHADRYPILDWRALSALGTTAPASYRFGFWWDYVRYCRKLADEAKCDMRTLDRALWQWSRDRAGR